MIDGANAIRVPVVPDQIKAIRDERFLPNLQKTLLHSRPPELFRAIRSSRDFAGNFLSLSQSVKSTLHRGSNLCSCSPVCNVREYKIPAHHPKEIHALRRCNHPSLGANEIPLRSEKGKFAYFEIIMDLAHAAASNQLMVRWNRDSPIRTVIVRKRGI